MAAACNPSPEVYDLRCEGLVEPLAIDSAEPHFGWKIRTGDFSTPLRSARNDKSAPGGQQYAYQIRVEGVWDSGKVLSAEQVMVPYGGPELQAKGQYRWQVRVWTSEKKASRWSRPQRFGVGILENTVMAGEYIGAVPGEGRAPLLRKRFSVERKAGSALLYVNSLGYHEAYLNGEPVSDAVLTPAVSELDRRSLIVTYDVTELLKKGENELVVWASSGWYKPATFGAVYEGPLVRAELDLDGAAAVWTDASWEGAWSGYRDDTSWRSYQFGGQKIDARVAPEAMTPETLDLLDWGPVDVVAVDGIAASQQMCEPCRVQEVLTAKSIEACGEGAWLVDFGQTMNAMADFRLPELPAGTVVKASFAGFLQDDGTGYYVGHNEYTASGRPGGDRFLDRFNHQVFRYVLLEGLPEAPATEGLRARRMRTDYRRGASFRSSDEELNAIHDMVAHTLENLSFDGYMVDCADIERLGYGGDGNASTLSLQILGDVAPLYMNWLQAWIDSIHEDGGLPHTAPNPYRAGGGPYWCGFIVQAPWRTWMSYGDDRLLHRCYPTMKHWLEYVDAYTVDGLLTPWPDMDYRWWFLGDWAAPDGVDVTDPASVGLVNNCSLCQVYLDLERIARLLGEEADAAAFRARYEALAARIQQTWFNPDNATYATGSQIDMVYPMLVGVTPLELVPAVINRLKDRTETVYGGHLATGLVGVPVLAEWATLSGECDWMYGMLKQHGYPGYLHMLDNGATGTWEHWNGRRSRLHNCFNGIGSWFYQALGGIVPEEPGYRRVRIAPQVPAGLEWVEVRQETPYGQICVSRKGKKLHFEIPVGVTAAVGGRDYGCGSYDIEL